MLVNTLFLSLTVMAGMVMATYNNNCHGSGRCNKSMGPTCTNASNRFIDGNTYGQYTSKVFGDCTAIFSCTSTYPSLRGSDIKNLFSNIYGNQGCKGCGSHAFNGGSCEVTYNYCANCRDSGPN
ncbi:meiotically up-regulated gene family-domain-containing protein [Umbelopsis sp. AD052]|nr:meiotically up-regulated gene family-domain-containing protein [Umbelopsis sp. AD052]